MSHTDEHSGTRRDFLYYATAAAGTVVTGAAVWPLVNQMNPSADVLALASIRVDISAVQPGTQITVLWQGKPVFIRLQNHQSGGLTFLYDVFVDLGHQSGPSTDAR